MALDNSDIIDRIQAILTANTTPVFNSVQPGEPLGLPVGDRHAAFWYLGREEVGYSNLQGQREIFARFQIACFWLRRPEAVTLEAFENEIADADQALKTAFRADATLTGTPSGPPYKSAPVLEITDSEVDYGGFPRNQAALYRSLMFELRVRDNQAEGTSL